MSKLECASFRDTREIMDIVRAALPKFPDSVCDLLAAFSDLGKFGYTQGLRELDRQVRNHLVIHPDVQEDMLPVIEENGHLLRVPVHESITEYNGGRLGYAVRLGNWIERGGTEKEVSMRIQIVARGGSHRFYTRDEQVLQGEIHFGIIERWFVTEPAKCFGPDYQYCSLPFLASYTHLELDDYDGFPSVGIMPPCKEGWMSVMNEEAHEHRKDPRDWIIYRASRFPAAEGFPQGVECERVPAVPIGGELQITITPTSITFTSPEWPGPRTAPITPVSDFAVFAYICSGDAVRVVPPVYSGPDRLTGPPLPVETPEESPRSRSVSLTQAINAPDSPNAYRLCFGSSDDLSASEIAPMQDDTD